jgi:hypothetical protein
MATVTITITLDVPDGTNVTFDAGSSATTDAEPGVAGLPSDVQASVDRFVPTRYREHAVEYLTKCVTELGCTVEIPSGERQNEYLNIYPPARCRRARVAGLTYSSTRTAIYTGPIDLTGYEIAMETLNSGVYTYPKLAHLDSDAAVAEAMQLTRDAIARVER